MQVEHIDDLGAYSAGGGGASILRFLPGPYKVGKVGGSSTSVITNTSRRGAYRGPWMFETIARELMLDIAARDAGIDPLELRRRNIVQQADLPYTTVDRRDVRPRHPGRDAGAGRGDARLRRVPARPGRGACRRTPPRRRHRVLRGAHRRWLRRRHHRVRHDPHRPERLHPGDERRELAGSQHGDDHRPGHRRVPRRRRRRRRGDVRRHRHRAGGRDHRRKPQRGLRWRRGAPGRARDARACVPDRRPHARGLGRRPRAWKVEWCRCAARRRRRRRSPRSRTSPT